MPEPPPASRVRIWSASRPDDGAPPLLDLPWDRPRPVRRSPGGRAMAVAVPAGLAGRMAALGTRCGVGPFPVWLAVWGLFLGRLAGQPDLIVGCPIGRRPPGGHDSPEALPDTALVRLHFADNPAMPDHIRATRAALGIARTAPPPTDLPAPDRDHNPLFQVMFAFRALAPLRDTALPASYDLALSLAPAPDGSLVGRLDYATDLLSAATVRRWRGYFLTLAAAAVACPDTPVLDLPLLPSAEEAWLVRVWSGAAVPAPPPAPLLPPRLLAASRTWPDRTAVADSEGETTYAGLEAWSRSIASGLRDLGVVPGDRVAVCLYRSRAWIAALWGVWRAGAAFVSLDPTAPPRRLATLAGQARPKVLAACADLAGRVGPGPWKHLPVGRQPLARPERADTPGDRECHPGAEACLVFTSGTSGAPKGIRIPQAALAFHAAATADLFAIAPGEAVLQFAPPGFDVAMEEIWPTLIRGGRLVICPAPVRESLDAFTDLCREARVAVANLPARFFEAWTAYLTANRLAVPPDLRLLVTGSEAVSARALADWQGLPGGDRGFLCGYGPTETTVTATFYDPARDGPPGPSGALPLGRPLPGVRAYVLDARGHPVPPGCVGALHLGGPGLALGYLEGPRSGNGCFRDDPFQPGERLYRPGDRAWLRPRPGRGPALILFAGRSDLQVKRRGYRIEPQEIEAAVAAVAGVAKNAVVPLEDGRLAAVVEPAPGRDLDPDGLRAALAETLPGYMLPDLIRIVDRLPQLPNGKPDRLSTITLAVLAGPPPPP